MKKTNFEKQFPCPDKSDKEIDKLWTRKV